MYADVLTAFPVVTKPLEGCVLWPYQDILGLITVGYGCLIDPVEMALGIHWDGAPSSAQVIAQWHDLKAQTRLAKLHFKYAEAVTKLRLTQAGADSLLESRAALFETELRKWFHNWDIMPADAQLAIMLIAWACGPAFAKTFTTFAKFVNQRDWLNAAKCATINAKGNPGIVPRNAQIQLCLANAAAIDNADGMPTPALYWPGHVLDAHAPLSGGAADALASFSIDECGQTGHACELLPMAA